MGQPILMPGIWSMSKCILGVAGQSHVHKSFRGKPILYAFSALMAPNKFRRQSICGLNIAFPTWPSSKVEGNPSLLLSYYVSALKKFRETRLICLPARSFWSLEYLVQQAADVNKQCSAHGRTCCRLIGRNQFLGGRPHLFVNTVRLASQRFLGGKNLWLCHIDCLSAHRSIIEPLQN